MFLLSKTLRSQRAKREGKVDGKVCRRFSNYTMQEASNRTTQRLWTVDCGLRTVDNGFKVHASLKKNSSTHILIFRGFLMFPVAKREMSNSSSLNLALPCWACQAWPLRGWGRGVGGAEIPFESDDGNVRRLLRGRNCRFWIFNIFTHMGISYGCA